ncbi:ATP-binding cassette domain-containing protein [Yinghuangia aomiensis]
MTGTRSTSPTPMPNARPRRMPGQPRESPLLSCRRLGRRVRRPPSPSTRRASRSDPGETYGPIGPNGAGKTTTIRMVRGLLRPGQRQHIRIAGRTTVSTAADPVKQLVGYVRTGHCAVSRTGRPGEPYLRFFGRLYRPARQGAGPAQDRRGPGSRRSRRPRP